MNVASIDIGTNTVLLLIADVNLSNKSLKTILNEYRMPRIGKGLQPGSEVQLERIQYLFDVLEEYSGIIKQHYCKETLLVGTNAFRLASNSKWIISEINRRWNWQVKIISGIDEAKLSYLGATYESSLDSNIVIDIGGGSTEVIYGSQNEIKFSKSFPIGVVRLTEKIIKNDPPNKLEVEKMIAETFYTFQEIIGMFPPDSNTIAVAGTPTSLAGINLKLSEYDEVMIENSILTEEELSEFINYFSSYSSKMLLSKHPVFLAGREDIIIAGTIILSELMKLLKTKKVIVSTKGIRYGSVVEYLQECNIKH